ncbi:hypothetical protein BKA00_003971 [Actinomadura coerulea]|uniref:Uncharacterized protein n=1 Tax=Actinomadura coerulea TaxID=46159 RepID=A0A7X0G1I2_9ACTN|nr:hypothetical protein [Actinomadura coerulea]MBB6397057.1 hypothetical protein [Actinomadura coerulea]GGP96304.1 hypothetical protein GCM10010187_10000 [Actinomadura coerulea]
MPTSADVRRALAGAAALLPLLASPAWADGGHGGHGAVPDGGWGTTAIRVVALLATAVVAGAALLRPRTGPPSRRLTVLVSIVAAVAAVGCLVAVDRVLVALALAAVVLATPRALQHPRRSAASGAVLAAALATLTVGGSLTVVRDRVAPGVPLLREVDLAGERLPILVTPQRPGWNLVHTGDRPVSVGTSRDPASATARMPGAPGTWRQVWLPPGRSRITLASGGRTTSLAVDTGRGPAASPRLRTDGPECASAALGTLVSGGGASVPCPADRLDAADAADLRATVGFLAGRGVRSVHLVEDGSPRSRAAAQAVREAGARTGVTIAAAAANRPVILVSGWSKADATLRLMARGSLRGQGAYLAPWLLSAPLLAIPAAQMLPLRFSPRDPDPLRYAAELRARFPDETPTATGYQAWRGSGEHDVPARLYAASLVTFMPSRVPAQHTHTGTSWLPGGTITVATGPLS